MPEEIDPAVAESLVSGAIGFLLLTPGKKVVGIENAKSLGMVAPPGYRDGNRCRNDHLAWEMFENRRCPGKRVHSSVSECATGRHLSVSLQAARRS